METELAENLEAIESSLLLPEAVAELSDDGDDEPRRAVPLRLGTGDEPGVRRRRGPAGRSEAEPAGGEDAASAERTAAPEEPPIAPADEVRRLAGIVESMLLASGAPVPVTRLVEALDGPERRDVTAALRWLMESYGAEGRGLRLVHVANGWQLRSAPEHGPWVRRLLGGRPPRLSRPMLETLAIIAYRQPCTRPEIEAIRGVDADAAVSSLLERRLVRIQGRKEAPGRPLLYATTKEFLEVFGLPDLAALPPLAELGDVTALLAERETPLRDGGLAPTPADLLDGSRNGHGAAAGNGHVESAAACEDEQAGHDDAGDGGTDD